MASSAELLEADFNRMVDKMKTKENVAQPDKLRLYALFQQATKGDCQMPRPNKTFIMANQKYQAWKDQTGMSKKDAMKEYIEAAVSIQSKSPVTDLSAFYTKAPQTTRNTQAPPAPPPLPPMPPIMSTLSSPYKNVPILPPALPNTLSIRASSDGIAQRREMLKSARLSAAIGVNPLSNEEDDVERREIYEKIRNFYNKIRKGRLNKGIGELVEWTMENGEDALNRQLLKKYGENLLTVEHNESLNQYKAEQNEAEIRRKNWALSQRLRNNAPPETREKIDKLTRFLLVNDPELVQRGMYIMMRFIEKKGIGALNENLMDTYGKNLDEIGDAEINEELKKKYGNDLSILEQPLFGGEQVTNDTQDTQDVTSPSPEAEVAMRGTPSIIQSTMETSKNKQRMGTLQSRASSAPGGKQIKSLLVPFLRKHEPNRFERALAVIGRFGEKNGIEALNGKLMEKYGEDLSAAIRATQNTSRVNSVNSRQEYLDSDECRLKLTQFLSHRDPDKLDSGIEDYVDYQHDYGLDALNTKLYMAYGESLEDLSRQSKNLKQTMSMAELHTADLGPEVLGNLNSFYAKYDPLVVSSGNVDKIFEYAQRNGLSAANAQLKHTYGESLSEFMQKSKEIRADLIRFYNKQDPSKIETQLENIIAWTLVNGREALNKSLFKKYGVGIDPIRTKRGVDF